MRIVVQGLGDRRVEHMSVNPLVAVGHAATPGCRLCEPMLLSSSKKAKLLSLLLALIEGRGNHLRLDHLASNLDVDLSVDGRELDGDVGKGNVLLQKRCG